MEKVFVRTGCGVDMSKKSFHACFGAQEASGRFVVRGSKKFDNSPSGIKGFLAWLGKQRAKLSGSPGHEHFQLVMETTGVYHEPLLFAVYESGLKVCLELAKRVKIYLRSIGQESKTDKLDASGICRMSCEREIRGWKPLTPSIYKLRSAIRHRKSLIISRNRFTNQLHALDHSQFACGATKSSLAQLIKELNTELGKAEARIAELYEADAELVRRLSPIEESLKGVGIMTLLTIVAETNGFDNITSRKQLASYAGYDILNDDSGDRAKRGRMSKQGNARIRGAMYMSAVCVVRMKDGPLYEFYSRVVERNPRIRKIANVALQRKLLLLVYTLFKSGEKFDPKRYLKKDEGKENSPEHCPELHEIEAA